MKISVFSEETGRYESSNHMILRTVGRAQVHSPVQNQPVVTAKDIQRLFQLVKHTMFAMMTLGLVTQVSAEDYYFTDEYKKAQYYLHGVNGKNATSFSGVFFNQCNATELTAQAATNFSMIFTAGEYSLFREMGMGALSSFESCIEGMLPEANNSSSTSTLLTALGIVFGVLFLCCLFCCSACRSKDSYVRQVDNARDKDYVVGMI